VKKAAPAKKVVAKKVAPAKKVVAKKVVAKKVAPAKKVVAKKVVAKKVAPAKKVVAKKVVAKKAAPAKKVVAKKVVAKKAAPIKIVPAKKAAAPKVDPKKAAPAPKVEPKKNDAKKAAPAAVKPASVAAPLPPAMPPRIPLKKVEPPKRHVIVKGETKDGITATKDFDMKFLLSQRELLNDERVKLVGQANRLENEANAMIADAEMGDVQFDDEGGEGDTMVVEREQDLTLSAFARQTVEEIDAALARMKIGEYGYSSVSGSPIPRERLKALPWATELVTERAGGLGRR
jgi:RNA polymerase-binding transcription factor DksA